MVSVMNNALFGTTLHVPMLLIVMCRIEHFCIFKDSPDARRQSLLSYADLQQRSWFSASGRFLVESIDTRFKSSAKTSK